MSVAALLNTDADLYREQRTADGMGGYTTEWVLQRSVRARFSQPSAVERAQGAQTGETLTHAVFVLAGTDVRRGDELRRGADVYRVLAVYAPSVVSTYARADVFLRQGGQ